MDEVYRIKQGSIYNGIFNEKIRFCIAYNDGGLLKFELYYDPQTEYTDSEIHSVFRKSFHLDATTVENQTIQADNLHLSQLNAGKGFLKLTCYGKITIVKKKHDFYEHESLFQKNINVSEMLYSIELEGLKMQFSDFTHKAEILNFESIGNTLNIERDHTEATLVYKKDEENFSKMYKTVFSNATESRWSDNVKLIFVEANLEYSEYLKFKADFICFLSLMNGAEVGIREEQYSMSMSPTCSTRYSFKNINNIQHSSYIPIDSPSHLGDNVVQHFLLSCFDNYRNWNKKLDFNYTIRLLCNATQAGTIEQGFITLIVALERLSSLNLKSLSVEKNFLLPEKEFEGLKIRIMKEIDLYQKDNNIDIDANQKNERDKAYDKLKNIIINSNRTDKAVRHKFKALIKDANIIMNPDIKNIIDKVRHTSIHMGEIEKWPKNLKNYFVLDELIRNIILNLINYKKVRDSRAY